MLKKFLPGHGPEAQQTDGSAEQPGDEENGVNNGTVPAVLGVTFFNVPHGGSNRIERTNPGNCPG
jgi:hypothetical protein